VERRRISDTNASRVANGLLGQRDQEKHVRDYALAKIRQINEGAVTNSKLAPDAVTSDKIQDSEVDTDDITDDAITGNKISDGSINQNHISESFMKSNSY
jgi:trimeric autotransporter adhesin